VPVYEAALDIDFSYDVAEAGEELSENEKLLWDQARLVVILPASRSFRGEAELLRGSEVMKLEPGSPLFEVSGIQSAVGDPRGRSAFSLRMTLGGAEEFRLSPSARRTTLELHSDWPHPSFSGDALPQEREVGDNGFTARWDVPHLVRNVPQKTRNPQDLAQLQAIGFGVSFFDPVDFYHLAERAAKYGILFIALTFLTVFLMEGASGNATHPAQFILIGLAQSVFFLLLISLAEQIGFGAAYLTATIATVVLLSFYGFSALKLGRQGWFLTGTLSLLYGVMYLILKSEDYALLAGSILAFAAVAVTMVWTRNEDWRRKPA
jgi:inner membrane protein